jgi:type I restriction enzyme S subunit
MNSLETVQLNLVLKEGWQRWKLSHAFNLIGSGTTPPTGSVEYFQKEIPWVNTGDLNDGYIYSVNKFVSEKAVSDFSALKVFPTDSLIIALYGATIGKLGILKIDACTNQACCILSEPNHLDTKFVFYWLMSERNNIIELAQGGGQPNISQEIVKNLRVFAPDIETQKLIATFLDRKTAAIDTLIAKKQRLIQLLEEKRTALINQAVTKGLNPNVPMKDSSIPWIGKIPEHWEIYHLNRVVKKFVDYRGKTPEKTKFGVPLITAGAIRHGEIDHSRAPEWVSEEVYLEIIKRGIPEVGDLLFTSEAPLGEVAIILDPEIALAQRVILFKVDKTKINSMFLKLHFLSLSGQGEIKSRASGSTAEGIRADRLKMSVVPTPPLEEQLIINSYVEERIKPHKIIAKKINSQIEKLQEYRRSLITAAVTGKLNIKEVETNV